jgi:signal transduction histidine kinase
MERWLPLALRRPTLGRVLLTVLALAALSQLAVGGWLYGRLQRQLETDLARRLQHVSALMAYSVDVPLVTQFGPGDERLAAYGLVRDRLAGQAAAAGASRAYVFDAESRTLVDTDPSQAPGSVQHRLLGRRGERTAAFAGRPAATRLYRDDGGEWRLSAFTPLRDREGRVVAVAGVDAPPSFFAALAALRREMLALGVVGLALAAIAGTVAVRQVERRLARLASTAARAARSDPRVSALPRADDVIAGLGRDLEALVGAIAAAREYQQAVLGSLDVGLLTCGADGILTLANERAHELLAAGEGSLVGRDVGEVLAAEPALLALVRSAAEDASARRAELPFAGGPAAGGRLLAASASHLLEQGRPSGLVVSLLDVTDLRRAEQRARENERLAALGGMAGGLLHELGNPLAALTMYLDLLRPLTPEGEARDLAERALREDARLREFLEDFRVFAGLSPLRLERVELAAVVSRALEPLASPAAVRWRVETSGTARGDGRLLAHALRNLLRNALEAGASRISVCAKARESEASLVVSDDGTGLAEAERALEPFHTTKPHGSGLGLVIVRRVMELHGGRVEALSGEVKGARFALVWPAGGTEGGNWRAS